RNINTYSRACTLTKVMLKGLSRIKQIEITGVENPRDFAIEAAKNQHNPLPVILFKCKYEALEKFKRERKKLSNMPEKRENKSQIKKLEKDVRHESKNAK
ncbi:hypothetical protein PMAYCL1PPCAC_11470, partial [Pristionchus mayeri]